MAAWASCCPYSMHQGCSGANMPDPASIVSNGIRKAKLDTGDRLVPWKASRSHGVMLMGGVFPNLSPEQRWGSSKLSPCTTTPSGCSKLSQHYTTKQCDQPDQKESKPSTICSLLLPGYKTSKWERHKGFPVAMLQMLFSTFMVYFWDTRLWFCWLWQHVSASLLKSMDLSNFRHKKKHLGLLLQAF